jgi:16S rRNA (adenine1518-N6/adenine1519-N6)-dimethyltransferase
MIRARKRFGQHFLEPAWVDKVIRAIDPKDHEQFIEIGPGRGALTRPLVARAKSVVAFEIDRDLAADLRAAAIPNLTVVEGDFLEQSLSPLAPRSPVRVAGNLPYNVASPILFRLAALYAGGVPIGDATVMLQREVADRLLASQGSKEYGVLSVLMQHNADLEMLLKLPAGAFRPPPKVLSALVRLRFHPPDPPVKDAAVFEALVQAVFTRRRKTLANALQAYRGCRQALPPAGEKRLPTPLPPGLDGRRRPETLTVAEFARLADFYAARDRAVL